MTWAPHPKALPQAVPNSFAEWMNATDYEFVITHPEGYELDPKFVGNARVEYDQKKAFEGADFIYAKNWAPVPTELWPGIKQRPRLDCRYGKDGTDQQRLFHALPAGSS